MPPKKAEKQGGGKKPSATKIVEDRTFGMKNKKGAQTQKQIAQMTVSAKAGGTPEEKKGQQRKHRKRERRLRPRLRRRNPWNSSNPYRPKRYHSVSIQRQCSANFIKRATARKEESASSP